jgi:hypothetical protein
MHLREGLVEKFEESKNFTGRELKKEVKAG